MSRQLLLRTGLLDALGREMNMSLKSRICDIVGELGGYVIDPHDWPEALSFAYHQVMVSEHEYLKSYEDL